MRLIDSIDLDRMAKIGLTKVCIAIILVQIAPLPTLIEPPVFVGLVVYVGFCSRYSIFQTAAIVAATLYTGLLVGAVLYWDLTKANLYLPDGLWLVPITYFGVWLGSLFFVSIGRAIRNKTRPIAEPEAGGSRGLPIAEDPRFRKTSGSSFDVNDTQTKKFATPKVLNIIYLSLLVVGAASCAVLGFVKSLPVSPDTTGIRVDITPQTVEALVELVQLAKIAADHDPRDLERIDTLMDVMESTRDWATMEWNWMLTRFFSKPVDRPIPKYSADMIDELASDLRGSEFAEMCETVTDVEPCHSIVDGVADMFHSIAIEMRKQV